MPSSSEVVTRAAEKASLVDNLGDKLGDSGSSWFKVIEIGESLSSGFVQVGADAGNEDTEH